MEIVKQLKEKQDQEEKELKAACKVTKGVVKKSPPNSSKKGENNVDLLGGIESSSSPTKPQSDHFDELFGGTPAKSDGYSAGTPSPKKTTE